jgi:predicted nuclease of predicted toxin-antitoxin system
MRLLFDQNLSPRLPHLLADLYPGSVHVRTVGLREADDAEVWEYAGRLGLVLASKDSDFQQRSFLFGAPPKVIWIRVGNCPVGTIEALLRTHSAAIHTFDQDESAALLIVPLASLSPA